jgi:hypothetical protein
MLKIYPLIDDKQFGLPDSIFVEYQDGDQWKRVHLSEADFQCVATPAIPFLLKKSGQENETNLQA